MPEPAGIVAIAADGDNLVANRHGAKACGLQRLMRLGLAVPAACVVPVASAADVASGRHDVELGAAVERLIDHNRAGRLAVRSGAAVSLPGAFDSVLDVDVADVRAAVGVVVASAGHERARAVAAAMGHAEVPPTAVVIQRQVETIDPERSGGGVVSSRHPLTGLSQAVGSFAWGTGAREVMAGTGEALPLDAMALRWPEVARTLQASLDRLDRDMGGPVEVEFVIDDGELWFLQLRRTSVHPEPATDPLVSAVVLASGVPAAVGVAVGALHVDVDDALDAIDRGEAVVLVLETTSPADVVAMTRSAAVVTKKGGRDSHASVVARSIGIPAVVSMTELEIGADHVLAGATRVEVGTQVIVDGAAGRLARPTADR